MYAASRKVYCEVSIGVQMLLLSLAGWLVTTRDETHHSPPFQIPLFKQFVFFFVFSIFVCFAFDFMSFICCLLFFVFVFFIVFVLGYCLVTTLRTDPILTHVILPQMRCQPGLTSWHAKVVSHVSFHLIF